MEGQLAIRLDGASPPLPEPHERRRVRERASLRLVDVAELLRVDISTVSRWERGQVEPHGSARLVYAAFLARLTSAYKPLNKDTPPGGTDGASRKTDAGGLNVPGYPR
jgi:transcriptional regulator with XRE-family HTH domain